MKVTIIYDSSKNPDGSYRAHEPGTWAKRYCPSYITNAVTFSHDIMRIDYYFSDEKDALAFSLKWA